MWNLEPVGSCLPGMTRRVGTTRRALLGIAGAAAGASVMGGCTADTSRRTLASPKAGRTHLIFVTTEDGVSVLDQDGRVVTPPTAVAAATPGWSHVVTAAPHGADTRVVVEDLASRQVFAANTLRDRLEPRVVSADGHLVASVTPGGAGIYGLHKPGGRERTTVVVSRPGGERARLDLRRQHRAGGVLAAGRRALRARLRAGGQAGTIPPAGDRPRGAPAGAAVHPGRETGAGRGGTADAGPPDRAASTTRAARDVLHALRLPGRRRRLRGLPAPWRAMDAPGRPTGALRAGAAGRPRDRAVAVR